MPPWLAGYGRADITRTAGSARTTRGKRRSGRVQGPGRDGVTVLNPADSAVAGFDLILARDGYRSPPRRGLATAAVAASARPVVPVAGVALTYGQGEYGQRRRHDMVTERITGRLGSKTCASVQLETRLDIRDWRLCSITEAFMSQLARLDIVVTTRLHSLALALSAGVPALAVDPVPGGGEVTAQARA